MKKKTEPFHILLLDDSPGSVVLFEKIANDYFNSHYNYQISKFLSVSDYMTHIGDYYDMAFVDWNMGDSVSEQGYSILPTIKKYCSNIAVITGQSDEISRISKYVRENEHVFFYKGSRQYDLLLRNYLELEIAKNEKNVKVLVKDNNLPYSIFNVFDHFLAKHGKKV